MLVDRMTYLQPWASGVRTCCLYRDVQRGDIICFHYPEDVRQIYVKRVIGLPGDRIHMENKIVVRNGQRLRRTLRGPSTSTPWSSSSYRDDTFPAVAGSFPLRRRAAATCSPIMSAMANSWCPREPSSCHGRQPRELG